MAPIIFHLISIANTEAFLSSIQRLPSTERPLYLGHCQHWIREPTNCSTATLLGTGSDVMKWNYLLIKKASSADDLALPPSLTENVKHIWSIVTESPGEMLDTYNTAQGARLSAPTPPLPPGWGPLDHSDLDASVPPADLEFSLELKSYSMGANRKTDEPVVLKDFIRSLGKNHEGPVGMLNLLSSNPGQRGRTFEYIAHFGTEPAITQYGGQAQFLGAQVLDWSGRTEEGEMNIADAQAKGTYDKAGGDKVGWENVALVWYPSVWHFGKLLDSPAYADADRKYKQGALRDGPILCCTEIEVEYEG